MLVNFACFNLLLNWRSSQGENFWPFDYIGDVSRIVKVSHDKVVEMLLVCMMCLI